jgi:fatty-acyl-CoA synthase
MGLIERDRGLDLTAFRAHVARQLPDYARPLFLRIQGENDVSGTFKQRKVDLVRQRFDPADIKDPIYFNDPATQSYVRLDRDMYERIQSGQVRM